MATEPLTARGSIHSRMPYEEYAALPGTSITRLKEMKRSPLHYLHRLTNPKETDALNLGSSGHVAILEPHRFDDAHAVWTKRTKAGTMSPRRGEEWDAFVAENEGRRILTPDELVRVRGMQKAVRGAAAAMRYLGEGDPEVSMLWTLDGRACKGRVDWLTRANGKRVLVGLKTSRDCRHFAFGGQAAKLGYHLQWAYYFDGFYEITGEVSRVVEIVVESAPPYAVAVYDIEHGIIEQGREEYRALLTRLAECEVLKEWPGPVPVEETLTLPTWVYSAEDDVADIGLEE